MVSEDRDLLAVLGLGFLLLATLQVGVSALRSWVVLYLGTTLNLQWLANVFSHLLRLPVSWFEKRHLGDVVSRFGYLQLDTISVAGARTRNRGARRASKPPHRIWPVIERTSTT